MCYCSRSVRSMLLQHGILAAAGSGIQFHSKRVFYISQLAHRMLTDKSVCSYFGRLQVLRPQAGNPTTKTIFKKTLLPWRVRLRLRNGTHIHITFMYSKLKMLMILRKVICFMKISSSRRPTPTFYSRNGFFGIFRRDALKQRKRRGMRMPVVLHEFDSWHVVCRLVRTSTFIRFGHSSKLWKFPIPLGPKPQKRKERKNNKKQLRSVHSSHRTPESGQRTLCKMVPLMRCIITWNE